MSLYNVLARDVLAPAYDVLKGRHTMQCLSELEESQWWPLKRIQELQSERLRRLIEYVYWTVPYYRRLMDERQLAPSQIRSAADLPQLPPLLKDIVRTRPNELLAEGFPQNELLRDATSGSTGMPLTICGTRDDRENYGIARSLRARDWAGIRVGDRCAAVGRPRVSLTQRGHFLDRLYQTFTRHVYIDPNSLSESSLPGLVDMLLHLQVRALTGYPAALTVIAAYIEDAHSPVPQVHTILTGGEQLLDHERRLLRRVFGKEPFSKYSTTEVFDLASECPSHNGMHVQAEDVIVEVVDDFGHPVPPGCVGRILITNLHNYGMPLIRYDIGDSGTMLEETCQCGRELPRLGTLLGRNNSYMVTESGRRLSAGTLYLERLAAFPVRQYQVIQEDLHHVVMWLVPEKALPPADSDSLSERIRDVFAEAFTSEINLHVRFTDRIESSSSGKHHFVISKVTADKRSA